MTTDIDFFSAGQPAAKPEGPAPAAAASPTTPAATPVTAEAGKPKASGWQDKIKPVHFLIVGGLLVMAWVVWPMLGSNNSQTISMGAPLPVSSVAVAPQPAQAQSAPPVATSSPRAAVDEETEVLERGGEDVVALKAALAQQHEQQQVLLAGQQELKATLMLLMAQVKQLNDAAGANKVAKTATAAPAHKPASKPAVVKPASTVPGLTLNTVYPGQAWIDAPQGRTYIVHVGDVVEGAQVLSIDESARVVQTTRGPIR